VQSDSADLQRYEHLIQKIETNIQEDLSPAGASLILDDEKRRIYAKAIAICYELGKNDKNYWNKAFEYVEKTKARSVLQALGNACINWSASAPEALLTERKKIISELSRLMAERAQGKSADDQIIGTSHALDLVTWQIERSASRYARLVEPLSAEAAKAFLKRFPGIAIIDYFVTEDTIFGFVVTDEGAIDALKKTFDPGKLNESVLQLYVMIEQYRSWTEVQQMTTYTRILSPSNLFPFYDDLFEPFKKALGGKELLYFLPDGVLYHIPFHALCCRVGEDVKFVIDDYDVAYAPSASVLSLLVERAQKRENLKGKSLKNCFAIGGPGLRYGQEEVEAVAGIFGAKPQRPTRESMFAEKTVMKLWVLENEKLVPAAEGKWRVTSDELAAADIVHLSCHSQMNPCSLLSTLRLEGTDLTVQDVYQLKLNASLVTLSACETQVSDTVQGRELAGFVGAFLQAGSPTVIPSLWKVDGKSTKLLMVQMCHNIKNGMTKVKALNASQRSLKSMQEDGQQVFICPYFWAPFVLVGSFF
jgi:CHAT domain-containing protein